MPAEQYSNDFGCCCLVNLKSGQSSRQGQIGVLLRKGDVRPIAFVQLEEDVDYKERRRGPRYPFIASAELIEQKADVRIASRVSELSMNGCYLDMMNPFPQGTLVLVKISAGEDFFQSKGKIVYSQMNMGAGVGFLEMDNASQTVLERWMDEAKKEALKNA
jgi:hypothetical protein